MARLLLWVKNWGWGKIMNNSFRVPEKSGGGMPTYQQQQQYPTAGVDTSARLSDSAAQVYEQTADQQAKGLEKLGQGIEQAAQTAYDLYADYQTSKAKDAWLQYKQGADAQKAELNNLVGQQAIDKETGVSAQIEKWKQAKKEELTKNLGGMAKALFEQAVADVDSNLTNWGIGKTHGEAVNYGNEQSAAYIQLRQNEALANADNPAALKALLGEIDTEISRNMASRNGWDATITQAKQQTIRQKTLMEAITTRIKGEQLGQANALINTWGADLGGHANELRAQVATEGRRIDARNRAERAERQFDVHSRAQDAIEAWKTGQDSPTAPSKQEVISAYGAEKGGRIWQSLESFHQLGADMKTLGTMTPEQQNELLEKRTPVPGDGFATAQEDHERLTRAIKADQEWRLKDPVGYLLANDKDAQSAFKAWQESPTPENTQSYVMKLRAGAAARGIRQSASEAQPVLPGNAAKDMAWRISNSDKPAEIIAQQKAAWGDYWPSVERQLVQDNKLPGGLRVIASGMDARSGGLLASTFRNPKFVEQSKESLGLTESATKDLRQRVQTEMAPFTATLRAQGDLEAESRLTDSATRLTLTYMLQGFDMKEAAAKSAKDVALDRYGINGSYRVPAGKDMNTISRGADNALFELTSSPDKLALPHVKGLSPEYIRQTYGVSLRRDASWVTAPDESGLMLYAGGKNVFYADGKPVFLTWANLEKSSKNGESNPVKFESALENYEGGGL